MSTRVRACQIFYLVGRPLSRMYLPSGALKATGSERILRSMCVTVACKEMFKLSRPSGFAPCSFLFLVSYHS